MSKRLPVISPLAPMFSRKRSPEAVAGTDGDQSRESNLPDERELETEEMFMTLPEEILSPVKLKALAEVADEVAVMEPLLAMVNMRLPDAEAEKISWFSV